MMQSAALAQQNLPGKSNALPGQIAGVSDRTNGMATGGMEELELIPLDDQATKVRVLKKIRNKPKMINELDNEKLTLGLETFVTPGCKEAFDVVTNDPSLVDLVSEDCVAEMRDYLSKEWAGEKRYRGSAALDKMKNYKAPPAVSGFRYLKIVPGILLLLALFLLCAWVYSRLGGGGRVKTKSELKKESRLLEKKKSK
jgi:hypothetical protein